MIHDRTTAAVDALNKPQCDQHWFVAGLQYPVMGTLPDAYSNLKMPLELAKVGNQLSIFVPVYGGAKQLDGTRQHSPLSYVSQPLYPYTFAKSYSFSLCKQTWSIASIVLHCSCMSISKHRAAMRLDLKI